jgi:hypothetical protein
MRQLHLLCRPWKGCASIHKAVINCSCLLQVLHVHMQACLYSSNIQAVITDRLLSWNCRIKALYQQATWVIWIMHPQNYQLIFDHKPAIHCSTTGIPWEPHNATYMPQFCITNWNLHIKLNATRQIHIFLRFHSYCSCQFTNYTAIILLQWKILYKLQLFMNDANADMR